MAVLVSVGALTGPNAAIADSENSRSGDNVVSVENYRDDSLRVRSRTSVAHARGDTVANQNVASAYASCTDCRTVAAAVQVVIVEGRPSDFRPLNLAVALNENCLRCQTFAYSRQVVLSPSTRVSFSDDAEDAIEEINEQIKEVARSQRSFAKMTADLDHLTEQLASVVRGEIQRAGTTVDEDDRRQVDEDDD